MSRAKGCRPLVLTGDIHEAVAADTGRAVVRVDAWTLRAMSIAVEAFVC
jgi:hypothetical protein